jgi:hypothetical protein
MTTQKLEVRLNEKEAAHYFSNAAALYVLGVGFAFFAAKAQSPFLSGVCFWFSLFLLCDCFRLARVCARLDRTNNLLLVADESGLTHNVSWLEPEHRSWRELTGFRCVKTPMSETIYFQAKPRPGQFLRFALFGAPKFDLPVSCIPGGREGLLRALSSYPEAQHLVPERAAPELLEKAA